MIGVASTAPGYSLAATLGFIFAVQGLGSHGEGPLKGALVGSTPHKLLQLSDRPVLVVPEPGVA